MMNSVQDLLEARYLRPGEHDWRDIAQRVARFLYPDDKAQAALTYALIQLKRFVPSSPVLMNAGSPHPMMCSCFVLPVEDSIPAIMESLTHTVMIQKYGGGVGLNFSPIRPEGSLVHTTGGRASGPVSFAGFWNEAMNVIRQGGKRQGAMMGVLDVGHKDLPLFLGAKTVEGRLTNFNLSVGLTEEFIEDARNGGSRVWPHGWTTEETLQQIAQHAWANGEPGVLFLNNINQDNPYDIPIRATNPCWSGETLVWTAHGPRTFGELASEGKDVQVLTQTQDGQLTFRTMRNPRWTGMMSVWELCLDNGAILRATGDHNIILKDGSKRMVKDLRSGDRLASVYRYKANQKGYLRLVNGTDEPLEHHVVVELVEGRRPNYPEEHCHHKDGDPANNVPENLEILPAVEHNRIGMMGEDNPMAGIWDERNPLFGRDVSGENNPRYRSDITVEKVKVLKKQGLTHQEVADRLGCSLKPVKDRWKLAQAQANHIVQWVRPTEETVPVYNGIVDETHTYFVLAGSKDEAILSANCGEVPLPPYGACCLGSLNLDGCVVNGEFDEDRLRQYTRQGVGILNRVLDRTWWPVQQIADFENEHRPIGLGVMGLADVLAKLCIPYASVCGVDFVHYVMDVIQEEASQTAYDLYHETGVMNKTLLSIAPTGSISMIARVNYSIEPFFSFSAIKEVEAGSFPVEVKVLQDVAELFEYTFTADDQESIAATGSVQYTGAPQEMKDVLLTATEMPWQAHLVMQAAVQSHVDNAVSKTINLPSTTTVEDVKNIIMMAEGYGLKGLTVYRNKSRQDEVISCPTGTCDL